MPLPVFDTLELVPEQFRGEYELRDGKAHPKAVPGADDLDKERRKAAALLDEKKEAERKLKAAEKERDDLKRTQEARDKGISEDELQKIRDAEALARKPIQDENDKLKAENRKLKLTDRVKALALAAGIMPDRIDDAMLALDRRTDLTDADGIVVKDKTGAVTTAKIEDFLKTEFKTEKPWLYHGSGASGSGATGSNGVTGTPDNGTYDPIAAGRDAAKVQKAGRAENALAFQ